MEKQKVPSRQSSAMVRKVNDFFSLEMEFLDVNMTIKSSLLLHATYSFFYWRRKPNSTLVFKILTTNLRNKKNRFYNIHEYRVVE
jgi:hypothetical protein